MAKNINPIVLVILIVLALLVGGNYLFSLFPSSGCGLVGAIKTFDSSGNPVAASIVSPFSISSAPTATKMCLPNGQWSGILDCSTGKCGIRETTNVRGMCNWLDLQCRNGDIYMCGRNGVFSSIGKISGYCGYETTNTNPPQTAKCTEGQETCQGTEYYICRFNSFTYAGLVNGKCGYNVNTNTNTNSGTTNINGVGTDTYSSFNSPLFTIGNIQVTWIMLIIGIVVLVVIVMLVKKK